jgi:hypothetical protein
VWDGYGLIVRSVAGGIWVLVIEGGCVSEGEEFVEVRILGPEEVMHGISRKAHAGRSLSEARRFDYSLCNRAVSNCRLVDALKRRSA